MRCYSYKSFVARVLHSRHRSGISPMAYRSALITVKVFVVAGRRAIFAAAVSFAGRWQIHG